MPNQIPYFDMVTEKRDDVRALMFREEVREAALRKASLAPHMVVADIGIGGGFIAEGCAPLVRKVYGLDVSAAMLAAAQRNLEKFSNVELRMIGGNNLSLEDNSVDVVFANMYLHHTPDPLSAIKEMVRILKPGGQLVIVDISKHDYDWVRDEMGDVWLGFERQKMSDWLAEVGLVNIDFDRIDGERRIRSSHNQEGHVSVFIASATKLNSDLKAEVVRRYTMLAGEPRIRSLPWGLYEGVDEIASIPTEAVGMSLGCGNPVSAADLRGGEVVLDIGCGAGPDVLLAAIEVGPEGSVIGLDLTPAMPSRSRLIVAKMGLSNVVFANADAEAIPLEDDSVDVILSNCSINLAVDKGKVFHEIERVLCVGGRLSIADVVTDNPLPQSLKGNLNEWTRCFAGALTHDEYLSLLTHAGFTDIVAVPGELLELYGDVSLYSVLITARKA